jgi:uncharacterized protein with FMN-binding domain
MSRVILAIVGTAIGLVLLLSFKTHASSGGLGSSSITIPNQNGTGTSSAGSSGRTSTSKSSGSGSGGSKSSAGSRFSGTATGDSVETGYGPIQVVITVKDGKITAVNVPVYPNGTERDVQINQYAVPQLIQETVGGNTANINAISGASYTSQGYMSSLQSAIDKAGI